MSSSHATTVKPANRLTAISILVIGVMCMIVAGYFLIEGLLQFGGNNAAKRMLIVAGILFQVTESLCFISAAALTSHSLRWRYSMFWLGIVLFSFSIAVMTFAQKAALETGEATAAAIDERRDNIREQVASLDELIASYRQNAEKQSKSIYAKSRQLGQDSINKAAELAEKKMELSSQLYKLNESRRQTSIDFFEKLEKITGLNALQTEFWFLFLRSLLLELCGIMLMSFGAHLYAIYMAAHLLAPQSSGLPTVTNSSKGKPILAVVNESNTANHNIAVGEPPHHGNNPQTEHQETTDNSHSHVYDRLNAGAKGNSPIADLIEYADKIARLYERGKLKNLGREAIRTALFQHHGIQIGTQKASQVSEIVKDYVKG